MRRRFLNVIAAVAALTLILAACGGGDDDGGDGAAAGAGGKTPKIGVILPDTKSSARWENNDKPLLEQAFKAAGVEYDIQNAQGDKTQFQTIADQMITGGANVLMIVNLDSGTGKAVLGHPVVVPPAAEYVADGAARQAAWTLAGGDEPPRWEQAGTSTHEAEATPAVRERYRERRDLTADQAAQDNGAASPDTIAADRVDDPVEGVART